MHYYIIMFAAGLGIPVLAALNSALGRHMGSPAAAATVLFAVALICAAVTTLTVGGGGWAKLASAPKPLFFAGALIAFYVLTITWIAPIIGLGNAVFLVLLGQMFAAAVIDHFGLLGAIQTPISLTRAAGIAAMAAGLFLIQKG